MTSWKAKDAQMLADLQRLRPDLKAIRGYRKAIAEFTSVKALKAFLSLVAADEDMIPHVTSHWWYTLDVTWVEGAPITTIRVSIPPSDLAAIVGVLETPATI